MAQIYGQAHLVIAWLGKPAEDTRLAFRLLEVFAALSSEPDGVVEGSEAQRHLLILEELVQELCLDHPFQVFADLTNAAWRGAFALVERPWFTRLWVVQEVALSSNLSIRCGKFDTSGDAFCSALRIISMIAFFPPSLDVMNDFNRVLQLTNLRRSIMAGNSQSFLHLAHRLSRWNCTDDRDRLNALVSVAFKGNPLPWFSPNYRTDVGGAYQIFAESYISATGNLDILHFAGDSRTVIVRTADGLQIYNVPYMDDELSVAATWSPDWRIKTRPLPFHSENSVNDSLAFSATHSAADFQLDSSRRILRVRVLLVDEMKVVGLPLLPDLPAIEDSTFKIEGILNIWFALARSVCGRDAEGDQGEDWMHRFAMTLIADGRTAAAPSPGMPRTRAQQIERFRCWAKRLLHVSDQEEDCSEDRLHHYFIPISEGISDACTYGYEAVEVCKYRNFFVTKNGRFGLGPAQTRPGSPIYLIHGLKTPFVLEKASEETCYHLRGECYVDGLMYGAIRESDMDTNIDLL
ncbi:hypothetical protein AYO20_10750 [Fonsecaea nubica]|uniref:Heterokaryon incompatibility domain-containing protein n=1 Tax=Fonsecaea nubica TaxID=856822 RepID=A0A178C2J2_9EURO|nr:hypothetical protein AYO20_10750 [Fonsecaea nubica]OAL24138.1 hypothetical protein AYO20_10750 [Fonsecaea nubica]